MGFDRAGFEREVGARLQLARKRNQMTQGELAQKIGITRATYANVEAGRQRIPVDIIWRAAVCLRVSFASLVPEPILQPKRISAEADVTVNGTRTTSSDFVVNSWGAPGLAHGLGTAPELPVMISFNKNEEEDETA